MSTQDQFRTYISNLKFKEALELLEKEKLSRPQQNQLVIYKQAWQQLQKDKGILLDTNEASIKQNQLISALLNFHDEIHDKSITTANGFLNVFKREQQNSSAIHQKLVEEHDNIRQYLIDRYTKRLRQKTDHRLSIKLQLSYTKAGTSKDFPHFDEITETIVKDHLADLLFQHKYVLIQGAPGAGKSTQMLELALDWLQKRPDAPLPIIINLASWKPHGDQLFHEWLTETLAYGYGYSKSLATQAIAEQEIIPFLDGLDEVGSDLDDTQQQIELRNACLQAIGRYLSLYNAPYLILCSRSKEYAQINDAPIRASLMVNPFSITNIEEQLSQALESNLQIRDKIAAEKVQLLLQKHPNLAHLLCTPFYYNIALDVFDEQNSLAELPEDKTQLPQRLIQLFIDKKLATIPNPTPLNDTQIQQHLAWLANWMHHESLSNFELTDFQYSHLKQPWKMHLVFGLIFGLSVGLVGFMMLGFINGWEHGLLVGGGTGILAGLIAATLIDWVFGFRIIPLEKQHIKWSLLLHWKTWVVGLTLGLISGLVIGLIAGVIVGLIFGVRIGLVFGLGLGVALGFIEQIIVSSNFALVQHPYGRLRSEMKFNILKMTFIFPLVLLISFGIQNNPFLIGLLGIFMGAITGFLSTSLFMHLCLRLAFFFEGAMPLRWVQFFRYVTQARILEQDGGQWRFRHQFLQDYFAAKYDKE